MAAAAARTKETSREDIEKKFREEFGRDLTADEKRLLGWAEVAFTETEESIPKAKKLA